MMDMQVYAQARILSGDLEPQQDRLLELLCSSAASSLARRLREGLTPEDCKADFVAGASLYALAALADCTEEVSECKVGDVTMKKPGKNTAANCLRSQAALIMAPYLRDSFSFMRV